MSRLPVPLGHRPLVQAPALTYKRGGVESVGEPPVSNLTKFLAVATVVLFLFALVLFIRGDLLPAGVVMLLVSFTIYYRETRL